MIRNIAACIFILVTISGFVVMETQDNTLTKQEKKAGWKLLFNGSNMSEWRFYQNKQSNAWFAKDGTLYCKPLSNKNEGRTDLITKKTFENFDLNIDWKISAQGNSGILYMVTEEFKNSYLSGPEYQIIDDLNFPEKIEDWQKTGANYAMNAAPDAPIKKAGEWNHTEIIVQNNHVEHWLNGKKVVSYELYSNDWKTNKAKGKWKDAPGYGMSKRGHIVLQDHGSEAWFKNIKIKEL